MLKKILFIIFLGVPGLSSAQELNCQVTINAQQINGDKTIFDVLKKQVADFMNNTRWTNGDQFKQEEKIECSILINVQERVSTEEFKGTIQVQSRRPVYKTNYNTVVINHLDPDFQFQYVANQPFIFNENTYNGNLISVLAFYANMIVGMDYETFSKKGGEANFQKAVTIVNNAQNAAEKGWKAFDNNRNRYWFSENILNPRFVLIREAMYNYHRQGLDVMTDKLEDGKKVIMQCIDDIQKVAKDQPNSFLLQFVFNAKGDEIINIFKTNTAPDIQAQIAQKMKAIDPGNAIKYDKIVGGN